MNSLPLSLWSLRFLTQHSHPPKFFVLNTLGRTKPNTLYFWRKSNPNCPSFLLSKSDCLWRTYVARKTKLKLETDSNISGVQLLFLTLKSSQSNSSNTVLFEIINNRKELMSRLKRRQRNEIYSHQQSNST